MALLPSGWPNSVSGRGGVAPARILGQFGACAPGVTRTSFAPKRRYSSRRGWSRAAGEEFRTLRRPGQPRSPHHLWRTDDRPRPGARHRPPGPRGSGALRRLTRAQKDDALRAMAGALRKSADAVLAANAIDVERATTAGTAAGIIDRLTLTEDTAGRHRRRLGDGRRPSRSRRRGRARLDPAQRTGDPPGARADGRRRDGLRGPAERDRRRRRPGAQERQRGAAARVVARPTSRTPPWST